MSFIPPNLTEICGSNGTSSVCQPEAVLFLQLLYQTFISPKPINPPPKKPRPKEFDFIIVGGGTAGCVLANRLSEVKKWNIVKNNPGYHGTGGYQSVQQFPYEDINGKNILKALEELGYKNVDLNGKEQLGAMFSQATLRDGKRQSTNAAFIESIRNKRSNLFIETQAYVTKIIFDLQTMRATGVEYTSTANNSKTKKVARAMKEVISSAGSINSPKLLMLSGIGPAKDLQKLKIKVVKNSPVGKNLHDHVTFLGIYTRLNSKTITEKSFEKKKADLEQYLKTHTGPLSSLGSAALNAFTQTTFEKLKGVPDGQFLFGGINPADVRNLRVLSYYNTIVIYTLVLVPQSRGFLKLNEKDPIWASPLLHPRCFTEKIDVQRMLQVVRKALQIFNTTSFKNNKYTLVDVAQPPCNHLTFNTDNYWICMMRSHTVSGYHQVGTCKMGPENDSGAVVNPRLKVYGVTGLRVIDASIMPVITRANPYAATIMIAENAADMIKKDWSVKSK